MVVASSFFSSCEVRCPEYLTQFIKHSFRYNLMPWSLGYTKLHVQIFYYQIYFKPLAAEFIYLASPAECAGLINRPTAVKGLDDMKKLKVRNHNIFLFFFAYWFLKFLVVICVWKAYQLLLPCQNCPTGQPAKPDKYYQQQNQNFTKTGLQCSHHVSLAWTTNTVIGALVYQGIPSDLWYRTVQSHHLPGALLPVTTGSQ